MKSVISLLLIALFLVGCGPKTFEPYKPPSIEFEKTPAYELDLSTIPKPDKIKPVYVDENLGETTVDKAKYVLLAPKEYAKVGALVKLATTYKKIALEEEELVNLHIDQINALKELLELERAKALEYRELWVNAENMYRYEKWEHQKDNAINRAGFYLMAIGSIVLLAFAL